MECLSGVELQVAAVMEVYANAAVAEICHLMKGSLTQIRTELVSQQKENLALKRKLKMIEIREAFYKRAQKLRSPDSKTPGRTVRVKIRSVDNQISSESAECLNPAPAHESCLPENSEDAEPDVLIIKEERVDNTRKTEPDLEHSLGVEQSQYSVPEEREHFLQQNTVPVCPQECPDGDGERHEFLKEENVEEHVAENDRNSQNVNGSPADGRHSAAEPEAEPCSAINSSWDSNRFEEAGHSMTFPGDCGEFYIHPHTGESMCHYGNSSGVPSVPDTVAFTSCEEELVGVGRTALMMSKADGMGSQGPVLQFKAGFPQQMIVKGDGAGAQVSLPQFKAEVSPQMAAKVDAAGSQVPLPQLKPGLMNQGRFVCKFCGKPFGNPSALVLHQRVHTGEKPFCCPLCGKRFSQSSSLRKHHSIHLGVKPFRCVHCGKRFSDQSNLRKHLTVHTGERPYTCMHCGKSFNQSSNLKTHAKIHTRERPFTCQRCGHSFAHKSSLAKHQQTACTLLQDP
ncbi:uncharacterized protein si:dkey-56e3.3 isoform X2 [Hoplias malabaricus]|uniref:uncharacterized protein si:dkey-56e3.3 isoform X2 n=1 Tax=Hoplias malabaricus TaxID=27720 RepID=UPI0034626F2B